MLFTEKMKQKRKNRFVLTYIFVLLSITSCTSQTNKNDIYSYSAEEISFKGKGDWIKEIHLYSYKKNGKFNILIDKKDIDLIKLDYYKEYDETSILISEIDYHYDFILIFKGNNKTQKHSFSNVIITKFKATPFDLYKITSYTYNNKKYTNDECTFNLD